MHKPFLCDLCKKRFGTLAGALDHVHTLHKRRKRPAKICNLQRMRDKQPNWLFCVEKQLKLRRTNNDDC